MVSTLKDKSYKYFESYNEGFKTDKYRLSEATPYNLNAIKKWIDIRDDYTFTDNESEIYYGDWEQLDIKEYHSKYGTNYIYLDHERKLWRIRTTGDEFYNHRPTKRKMYDVYFKPKMSGVVCIKAYNQAYAKKMFEEGLHNMSKEEIIERLVNAMEVDGYELEVIGVEEAYDLNE